MPKPRGAHSATKTEYHDVDLAAPVRPRMVHVNFYLPANIIATYDRRVAEIARANSDNIDAHTNRSVLVREALVEYARSWEPVETTKSKGVSR